MAKRPRAVCGRCAIVTPNGVRPLIEAAYDPEGEIPSALRVTSDKANGQERAHSLLAQQNVLSLNEGYRHGKDAWDSDISTPTRIMEETTTLRLARFVAGAVEPWCQALEPDPQRAWALSEVTVRKKLVKEAVVPSAMETAVNQARAAWPEWDRTLPVLVLEEAEDGGASGMVTDANRRLMPVSYAADGAGLVFLSKCGKTR